MIKPATSTIIFITVVLHLLTYVLGDGATEMKRHVDLVHYIQPIRIGRSFHIYLHLLISILVESYI